MGTLKANALLVWGTCQLLGYIGLASAIVFGLPSLIVLALIAAGQAHR